MSEQEPDPRPSGLLIYLTHPNVSIDPAVPVPQWSLSELGRKRVEAMLQQPWLSSIDRVISSAEVKAREAAEVLAAALHTNVEVRVDTGETDRSATGFVPHEQHEALAATFFAEPHLSAEGWERAVDVQQRIVQAFAQETAPGDEVVAVVGHGAAGTLLMCHLADLAIDQRHDQPGQGHYWVFDRTEQRLVHGWQPIEEPRPLGAV